MTSSFSLPHPDLTAADPETVARWFADLLWKKQGSDIRVYRTATVTIIADYFVLVTGRSSTHVKALSDEIVYEAEQCGVRPARVEGRDGAAWILLDYGSVIVHVFDRASREFYHLERLLGEDTRLPIDFEAEPTPAPAP